MIPVQEIQLVITIVAFISMVVLVFFIRTSDQQHYVSAMSTFVFFGMLGYFIELTALDLSDMHMALRLEYVMNCLVPLTAVCFMKLYSKHPADKIVTFVVGLISILIIVAVYSSGYHHLYYRDVKLIINDGVSFIKTTPGPLYYLWVLNTFFAIGYFFWLVVRAKILNTDQWSWELNLCVLSALIPLVGFVLTRFGFVKNYELGIPMVLLGEFTMFFVTVRFKMYDTLKNAKEVYIRTMDEGILVVSKNGNPQFHNPQLEHMFPEVRKWSDADEVKKYVVSAVENSENRNLPKGGRYYRFEKNEMRGGRKSEVRGYIYRVLDVTETNEYNRQLSSLRDEALRASHVKNIFIANISHEIRTPINSIINTNEKLQEMEIPNTIRDYSNNIDSASRSLMLLINDILDISKLEAGKLRINREEYDPAVMLYDAVSLEAPLARGKKLPLKVTVNPELPVLLMGDDARISQCVCNILDNAIKYTESGHVAISMDFNVISAGRINLVIKCSDTGVGIDEDELPNIFDTFSVVNSKRNKDLNTFSVSLSMSKRLITMMKGEIKAESVKGVGSTFTISIPQTVLDDDEIGSYGTHVKNVKKKRADI
nr:hypothetical protein [Lachnospiraceae bacterium]